MAKKKTAQRKSGMPIGKLGLMLASGYFAGKAMRNPYAGNLISSGLFFLAADNSKKEETLIAGTMAAIIDQIILQPSDFYLTSTYNSIYLSAIEKAEEITEQAKISIIDEIQEEQEEEDLKVEISEEERKLNAEKRKQEGVDSVKAFDKIEGKNKEILEQIKGFLENKTENMPSIEIAKIRFDSIYQDSPIDDKRKEEENQKYFNNMRNAIIREMWQSVMNPLILNIVGPIIGQDEPSAIFYGENPKISVEILYLAYKNSSSGLLKSESQIEKIIGYLSFGRKLNFEILNQANLDENDYLLFLIYNIFRSYDFSIVGIETVIGKSVATPFSVNLSEIEFAETWIDGVRSFTPIDLAMYYSNLPIKDGGYKVSFDDFLSSINHFLSERVNVERKTPANKFWKVLPTLIKINSEQIAESIVIEKIKRVIDEGNSAKTSPHLYNAESKLPSSAKSQDIILLINQYVNILSSKILKQNSDFIKACMIEFYYNLATPNEFLGQDNWVMKTDPSYWGATSQEFGYIKV